MEWTPLVSIVIPVYNGDDYLGLAIDSALAQDYENLEILVINDGSRDQGATELVAKKYGKSIRYIAKENGGVASALNLGIQEMKGDYFSWLSHDDLFEKDKISKQIEHLRRLKDPDQWVVYSDYKLIDPAGKEIGQCFNPQSRAQFIEYEILCHQVMNGCAMLIPKAALTAVGGFDESLPTTQDYDLWLRLAKSAHYSYCPGFVLKSRQHPHQGSRNATHRKSVQSFYAKHLPDVSYDKIKAAFAPQLRTENLRTLLLRLMNVGLYQASMNLLGQALTDDDLALRTKVRFFLQLTKDAGLIALKQVFGAMVGESLKFKVKVILSKLKPRSSALS